MRAIALAPIRNTPGKKDATGAFQPELHRFRDFLLNFPKSDGERVQIPCYMELLDEKDKITVISEYGKKNYKEDLNIIAIFSHGLPGAIKICGKKFIDFKNYKDFVKVVFENADKKEPIYIGLYACLTGKNLAHAIAIEMSWYPVRFRLIAHTTAGHTTYNPYVIRFTERDLAGSFICQPGSPEWKGWRRRLREDKDLRFRILFEDVVK